MAYQDRDAVIVGAVRTPVGKGKASGALHGVLPADLLAHSLRELVQRTGVDPGQIDDVIAGAVTQVGDQAVMDARPAARVFEIRIHARKGRSHHSLRKHLR